jgi:hypothetical protein
MDKTEHTHPKNGLDQVYKLAQKASKNGALPFKNAENGQKHFEKRSIATQTFCHKRKSEGKRSIATHFHHVTTWY